MPEPAILRVGELMVFRLRLVFRATSHWTLPPNPAAIFHALFASAHGLNQGEDRAPEGLIPEIVERGLVRVEPGESYVLGLTWLAADSGELQRRLLDLVSALRKIGKATNHRGHPLTGNFELIDVFDLVGRKQVTKSSAASPLDDQGLEDCLAKFEAASEVRLVFESPLRLKRPAADRRKGAGYFDADYFDTATFLRSAARRLESLGVETPSSEAPRLSPTVQNMAWLDLSYGRWPRRKHMGGVMGEVTFAIPTRAWMRVLLLAELVNVGWATSFGYGRFRVEGAEFSRAECLPLESLLERALRRSRAQMSQVDERLEPGEVAAGLAAIEHDRYEPDPRSEFVVEQGKKRRRLSIPSVRDRALQRLFLDELSPYFDSLFENSSFAHRRGLNTREAARALQRAFKSGFKYAWKLDFADYFDSIDLHRLEVLLGVYLGDSRLVTLLLKWVGGVGDGKGIPVGAPISPLLANLFLDHFDEEIEKRGRRLVRYADDFVLLFRKREEAEAALIEVQELAETIHCRLNDEKTVQIDFDQPFEFLGIRFSKTRRWSCGPAGEIRAIEDLGWKVPKSTRVDKDLLLLPGETEDIEARADDLAILGPEPSTLCCTSGGRLICQREGAEAGPEVDLDRIARILALGPVKVEGPALSRLLSSGVELTAVSRKGTFGFSWGRRLSGSSRLLFGQVDAGRDESLRLDVARQLVAAKLHNHGVLADASARSESRRGLGDELRALSERSLEATGLAELRGVEGSAARLWYGDFSTRLRRHHFFPGRRAPRASDPINVMLNLAQTILHEQIAQALESHGLQPALGLFHECRAGHSALASDLQEPFRHLVDRAVIVASKRIGPDRFSAGERDDSYALVFDDRARSDFVRDLLIGLGRSCLAQGTNEAMSFRHHIDRQCRSLRACILNPQSNFKAFRHT